MIVSRLAIVPAPHTNRTLPHALNTLSPIPMTAGTNVSRTGNRPVRHQDALSCRQPGCLAGRLGVRPEASVVRIGYKSRLVST